MTSQLQRCDNVLSTTFMVYLDMNLLSNTEVTLKQLCNFDVVASASVLCALFARRCDLTTNIVTTFCVCWVLYFSWKYNWRYEFFFTIWVFIHKHSQITGPQGKGEGISLTPYYHFHLLHRHLNISQAITAESSPLHIASSRNWTRDLWFPSASCYPTQIHCFLWVMSLWYFNFHT